MVPAEVSRPEESAAWFLLHHPALVGCVCDRNGTSRRRRGEAIEVLVRAFGVGPQHAFGGHHSTWLTSRQGLADGRFRSERPDDGLSRRVIQGVADGSD
jgi:hypothetical protein